MNTHVHMYMGIWFRGYGLDMEENGLKVEEIMLKSGGMGMGSRIKGVSYFKTNERGGG